MKNTHGSSGDLVTDEVQIDLVVLGTLMLHRIHREINNTLIVIVNQGGAATIRE
jgi:hypothetical protein